MDNSSILAGRRHEEKPACEAPPALCVLVPGICQYMVLETVAVNARQLASPPASSPAPIQTGRVPDGLRRDPWCLAAQP